MRKLVVVIMVPITERSESQNRVASVVLQKCWIEKIRVPSVGQLDLDRF
jgi:hypothetical protein